MHASVPSLSEEAGELLLPVLKRDHFQHQSTQKIVLLSIGTAHFFLTQVQDNCKCEVKVEVTGDTMKTHTTI